MKLAMAAICCVWACSALAQGAEPGMVTVEVHDVAGRNGTVVVALCGKDTFLKKCELTQQQAAHGSTVIFKLPASPGRYAVSAYHDANQNGKLDRNLVGLPTEGYGFSRDARIRFGPPSFDDAAFDISSDGGHTPVHLRY
jgi:uncharacterized protein (DUF2141 family)